MFGSKGPSMNTSSLVMTYKKFVLPVHEDTKTKLKNKIFSEVLKWRDLQSCPPTCQGITA
jgi:hypothetical protein